MYTLIYRKADGVVAGIVPSCLGKVSRADAIAVELENILQSECGGSKSHYAQIETDTIYQDNTYPMVVDEQVVHLLNSPTNRDLALARKKEKLLALGLTEEEIDA